MAEPEGGPLAADAAEEPQEAVAAEAGVPEANVSGEGGAGDARAAESAEPQDAAASGSAAAAGGLAEAPVAAEPSTADPGGDSVGAPAAKPPSDESTEAQLEEAQAQLRHAEAALAEVVTSQGKEPAEGGLPLPPPPPLSVPGEASGDLPALPLPLFPPRLPQLMAQGPGPAAGLPAAVLPSMLAPPVLPAPPGMPSPHGPTAGALSEIPPGVMGLLMRRQAMGLDGMFPQGLLGESAAGTAGMAGAPGSLAGGIQAPSHDGGVEVLEVWDKYLCSYRQYAQELGKHVQADPSHPMLVAPALGGMRSEKVCVHHLTGVCRRGMRCPDRHPVDMQFKAYEWDFKRKQCRYGDQCYSPRCLYYHPREGSRWGDQKEARTDAGGWGDWGSAEGDAKPVATEKPAGCEAGKGEVDVDTA